MKLRTNFLNKSATKLTALAMPPNALDKPPMALFPFAPPSSKLLNKSMIGLAISLSALMNVLKACLTLLIAPEDFSLKVLKFFTTSIMASPMPSMITPIPVLTMTSLIIFIAEVASFTFLVNPPTNVAIFLN